MIRTSKRKFVGKQLNDNKNAKKWWATVKKLTTNNESSHTTNTTTVIEDKCLSDCDVAKNLNSYFKSVGGEARKESPPDTPSSYTPLQHISLGEIKMLLSKIDRTKACNTLDFLSWVSIDGCEDVYTGTTYNQCNARLWRVSGYLEESRSKTTA